MNEILEKYKLNETREVLVVSIEEFADAIIKKFEDFIKDISLKTESKHTTDDKDSKVKVDGEHKHLAGVKEVIEVVGLGKMKVKLDSGNSSLCALIVQDFKEDKENEE